MGPEQIGPITAAVAALGGLLAGAAAWRASDAEGGTDGDNVSVGGDGRAMHCCPMLFGQIAARRYREIP